MLNITAPKDPMRAGRLRKALNRVYRFQAGTMTLAAFLNSQTLTRRSHYIRHYARKKRDLCYARLKHPKHEYTIWRLDEEHGELGTDVPKIVFDALGTLPTTESEEYHD